MNRFVGKTKRITNVKRLASSHSLIYVYLLEKVPTKFALAGREPWSSGYAWRLMFKKGRGFESQRRPAWTFFHIDLL